MIIEQTMNKDKSMKNEMYNFELFLNKQLISTHNNSQNLSPYQIEPTLKQEITNTSNYTL
jgi:hypothetical protein